MTVLVVGGSGFVGGHVVHAFRAEDLPVRVLARRPDKQERFRAWGCELVQGDMTDADSLRRAAEGAETVVHLVALPPFAKPAAIRRVMEQGTRDLVAAATGAGAKRFVLMSALGTSERTKDLAPYYHAKWEEEHEVAGSGIDHTIFRPSFVFGRDGGMLPGLVSLTRYSPVTPAVGTKRLQPIWVEDVAAYFAKALATPAAANRTFELGGPDVVTYVHVDVTSKEEVDALFRTAKDTYGSVDIAFNNAGISPPEDDSILDTDLEAWRRVQEVNLTSVYLCCKAAIPHMQARGRGSIINTASFVARMGAATSQISYTASKGGVLAMSRELGVQFAREGIRVNALSPGPVNTPLLQELFAKDPERAQRRLVHVPMGRFAEPEELAAAVAFLASDDSSFITASAFVVDGGITNAYVTPL